MLMRVVHGPRQLLHQSGRFSRGHRRAAGLAIQASAVDDLHGEERQAVVRAHLVDLDDVRVLQAGDGLGLGQEAGTILRPGVTAGENHFQGDEPVEGQLPGLVDDTHRAAAENGQDFVAGDNRRGHRLGVRRLGRRHAGIRGTPLDRFGRPGRRIRRGSRGRGCVSRRDDRLPLVGCGHDRVSRMGRCSTTDRTDDERTRGSRTLIARVLPPVTLRTDEGLGHAQLRSRCRGKHLIFCFHVPEVNAIRKHKLSFSNHSPFRRPRPTKGLKSSVPVGGRRQQNAPAHLNSFMERQTLCIARGRENDLTSDDGRTDGKARSAFSSRITSIHSSSAISTASSLRKVTRSSTSRICGAKRPCISARTPKTTWSRSGSR